MEDKEDPSKTRITPTTSIQFLCPGRIDENTVYWDININTGFVLFVLFIIVTVLPDIIPDPYIASGQMAAYERQWNITIAKINRA